MNKPVNINEKETLNSLEKLSDEELVSLKNQAVADEDYLRAYEIKQELNMRKKLELESEKKDEESQNKNRIEELNKKLSQPEENESKSENINISDKELECVEDLIRNMNILKNYNPYISDFSFDENLIGFKSLNDTEKNEYFHNHEIHSKRDFHKHVLQLCRDYLTAYYYDDMKYRTVKVNEDVITRAIHSLNSYYFSVLKFENGDYGLGYTYNRLNKILEDMRTKSYIQKREEKEDLEHEKERKEREKEREKERKERKKSKEKYEKLRKEWHP